MFVNSDWDDIPDKTIYPSPEDVSFLVTYRNEEGKRFRLRFRLKKYPIGFHVNFS